MPVRALAIQNRVRQLRIDRAAARALIARLDEIWQPKNRGELSLVFLSHELLAELHERYCADPSPTDIITFPADDPQDEGAESLGELCISPQAAVDYIQKQKSKKRKVPKRSAAKSSQKKHLPTKVRASELEAELRRYIIHGYLHLLGYDDLNPRAKQQMRRQEKRGLKYTADLPAIFKMR
jgi:probable rRNA maturation factor